MNRLASSLHQRATFAALSLLTILVTAGVLIGVGTVIDDRIESAAVTRISDLEVINQIQMTNASGPTIKVITSDPNGAVTEPRGSLRLRTDVGNATVYQNLDGASSWQKISSLGSGPLAEQIFTGASGTYTPTSGTKRVRLRMTGAGGGGGAAQSGAIGTASFGAGGSSGTYLEKWIDPGGANITGGAWTGSATGGSGGTGGTGNGVAGTDATIVIQGVIYTAKGGPGGLGMATSSSPASLTYAWPNSDSSGPADFISASPGQYGVRYANGIGFPGSGGSNPFGSGGAVNTGAPVNGGDGRGFGAGGGGALAWDTSFGDKIGGNGAPTLIIVEEWP